MHDLRTIVYVSTAKEFCNEQLILGLLTSAQVFNYDNNITGALTYHDGTFFQCIEGEDNNIGLTYDRIKNSRLHHNINILLDMRIGNRSFPNWTMGFLQKPINKELRIAANQWDIYSIDVFNSRNLHPGAVLLQNYWRNINGFSH